VAVGYAVRNDIRFRLSVKSLGVIQGLKEGNCLIILVVAVIRFGKPET
jgi:hypothetical protein